MSLSRRHFLMAASTTAFASCNNVPPSGNSSAERGPAAAPAAPPSANNDASSFAITINVTGGYALAFSKKGGASLASVGPGENCHYDHEMFVKVDPPPEAATTLEKKDDHYVIPQGLAVFTEGVNRERHVKKSKHGTLARSVTSQDLANYDWDDFKLIPDLKKAHPKWPIRYSRRIVLPGGPSRDPAVLHVDPPKNYYALRGVWTYQSKDQPYSDRLRLEAKGYGDSLVLTVFPSSEGDAQVLVVRPRDGKVTLDVIHTPKPDEWSIKKGDKLPHFQMFYYMAENMSHANCDNREVPVFASTIEPPARTAQQTTNRPFTPGDFCPPFQIAE